MSHTFLRMVTSRCMLPASRHRWLIKQQREAKIDRYLCWSDIFLLSIMCILTCILKAGDGGGLAIWPNTLKHRSREMPYSSVAPSDNRANFSSAYIRLFFSHFFGNAGEWTFRNLEFWGNFGLEFWKNAWVFKKFRRKPPFSWQIWTFLPKLSLKFPISWVFEQKILEFSVENSWVWVFWPLSFLAEV